MHFNKCMWVDMHTHSCHCYNCPDGQPWTADVLPWIQYITFRGSWSNLLKPTLFTRKHTHTHTHTSSPSVNDRGRRTSLPLTGGELGCPWAPGSNLHETNTQTYKYVHVHCTAQWSIYNMDNTYTYMYMYMYVTCFMM